MRGLVNPDDFDEGVEAVDWTLQAETETDDVQDDVGDDGQATDAGLEVETSTEEMDQAGVFLNNQAIGVVVALVVVAALWRVS